MSIQNWEITELLNEANATTDQEVRKGLFQEICRMINDDNAAIFVDYGNQVVASNPSISGLMLHPDQVLRLSRVTKS